jgi:hypothetical protein
MDGLPWSLVAVQVDRADDALARDLLRATILDSRSETELIQVALSEWSTGSTRLRRVVRELSEEPDMMMRLRARYLCGWLPPDPGLRVIVSREDSSGWVSAVGRDALERLDARAWSDHWLRAFLTARNTEDRWRFGRLFLCCTDVTTSYWAKAVIRDADASGAVKMQAWFLLDRIDKKADGFDFKDRFLGCKTDDLAEVLTPWHVTS